jgi:hypothetical protein
MVPAYRYPRCRIEFRWPRPARADAGGQQLVVELDPAGGAAQHQAAAAHVTAADERRRISEAIAKDRQQHIHILTARDAAEQHHLRLLAEPFGERLGITLERRSILGVLEADIAHREFPQQAEIESQ